MALAVASADVIDHQLPMRTTMTMKIWRVRVRVVRAKMRMTSQWLLTGFHESRK